MRLVLSYITADARNHHEEVSHTQLRSVLGSLGWLPSDDQFASGKLKEVLDRFPEAIRSLVAGGHPILITTRPGTWGVVSTETRSRVFIRLLHDDLSTLREEAEDVVRSFPEAFRVEIGRDLGFEADVVIRRFDTEARMVPGKIQALRDYSFPRYVREVRKRESLVTSVFVALTLLTTVSSVLLFLLADGASQLYERGYLDRAGTTLFTAALTILVNLIFDYRGWKNEKVRIKWDF